jgi:hypothetical protein
MKMVGHKTESIYRRYGIVDEATLQEQVQKLEALRRLQLQQQGSVPISVPAPPSSL